MLSLAHREKPRSIDLYARFASAMGWQRAARLLRALAFCKRAWLWLRR
jgi:hypothetical protein